MSSAAATAVNPGLDTALVARLTATVTATSGSVTTTAPFTGKPLAELPQSSTEDVAHAFKCARLAQSSWAATGPRQRAAVLTRFHDLLLRRQSEILDIIQWETGKSRSNAFEEVLEAASAALYVGRRAPRLLRDRRRSGAFPGATRAVESRRPKGVVTVITPWNYPLALTDDVFPAFAAGNAVVQKPDTQTALTALWTRELMIEAGLPAELWQVVAGDPAIIGDPLIEHADYVAFTGSTGSGRKIAENTARRLIGCSLELGGKNPMIVLPDADLDRAAAGAVRACFANAGQLCVSIERLYVHESVRQEFTDRLVKRVESLRLGSALDFSSDVGSLTSQRQLETVTAHVNDAVAKGAKVLVGGRARPDLGPLFYEPTVLAGVTDGMTLCRNETFGPVVSLYPFQDEDEAVRLANDTPYGLNASVWSRNVRHARAVAARIQAGTVNINEGYAATYGSQGAPMGGMKQSGLGRRHADEGVLKLTEPQNVASQHIVGFDPPFGLSTERYAALLTRSLGLMKKFRVR